MWPHMVTAVPPVLPDRSTRKGTDSGSATSSIVHVLRSRSCRRRRVDEFIRILLRAAPSEFPDVAPHRRHCFFDFVGPHPLSRSWACGACRAAGNCARPPILPRIDVAVRETARPRAPRSRAASGPATAGAVDLHSTQEPSARRRALRAQETSSRRPSLDHSETPRNARRTRRACTGGTPR